MATKSGKASYRSTHKILQIIYKDDFLLCICGWIGRAYDNSELKGDDKDWPFHRRNAPPTDLMIDKAFASTIATQYRKGTVLV